VPAHQHQPTVQPWTLGLSSMHQLRSPATVRSKDTSDDGSILFGPAFKDLEPDDRDRIERMPDNPAGSNADEAFVESGIWKRNLNLADK